MPNTTAVQTVAPAAAREWITQGRAVLIDVREPDERAREWIPEAVSLPLGQVAADRLPQADGRRIIFHCAAGMRSAEAAARVGGAEVYSLAGGIRGWKAAGLGVQSNARAPLPIMRQVQIVAGSLVAAGSALGAFVSPWWMLLSGFVGAGLVFAGVSGFCGMATVLARMPWNRRA